MKYVTKDGKEFEHLFDARLHEKELKAQEKANRPTPRARSTDALPQDMVSIALKHPHGDLAAQVITLSNQIRARRKSEAAKVSLAAQAQEHNMGYAQPCAAEQDFPL